MNVIVYNCKILLPYNVFVADSQLEKAYVAIGNYLELCPGNTEMITNRDYYINSLHVPPAAFQASQVHMQGLLGLTGTYARPSRPHRYICQAFQASQVHMQGFQALTGTYVRPSSPHRYICKAF